MRRVLIRLLAVLALIAAALALTAAAPQTSLNDLEDEVMCPVCGVPLNIAEAPQAEDERRFIRGLIAQGKTKDEIKEALVVEYGDAVLATPKSEGFGIAAWLVPVGLVAALVLGLVLLLPRWRRRGPPAPLTSAPALSSADALRLDEDLARHR